jgi:N-methylhydantoinase A
MHAPILARELGVKKVIVPTASSVFSAWGMLMTDLRRDYIQTYIKRLGDLDTGELTRVWQSIETQALRQYEAEGIAPGDIMLARFVDMRYVGQEHTVKVPAPGGEWEGSTLSELVERFHSLHEQMYTFKLEQAEAEIVNLHVTAFGKVKKPVLKKLDPRERSREAALIERRPVYYEGEGWVETEVYDRTGLAPGTGIEGPAIIEEKSTSTVLHPGQKLVVDEYGNLIIHTGVK